MEVQQQREVFLREVLNNITEAIVVADDEGRYVDMNPAACMLFGYSETELKNMSVFDVTAGLSFAAFREQWQTFLEYGYGNGEYLIRRKDGTELITEFQAVANFMPGFHLSIMRDISERKQVEKKLQYQLDFEKVVARVSTKFVSATAETLRDAIEYSLSRIGKFFDIDRSYIFKLLSDGKTLRNIYEWCAEGITPQRNVVKDFNLDDLPWLSEQMRSFKHAHIPDVKEFPREAVPERHVCTLQGIQSNLTVPLIMHGKLAGHIGFDSVKRKKEWSVEEISLLKVVTEIISSALSRYQMEQEVKEAHDRLLTVLDSIDAFVYVTDMETYDILFVNKYGKNLFGKIVGKKCWHTVRNDQTGPCKVCTNDKLLDSSGRPKGVYHWELENEIDGRWYDCRDVALRWIDGRMVRLAMATDITAYKQLQEVLQKKKSEAEDALYATEGQYRFLINNVNEAIIVAQDGFFVFVNPMAAKLFACSLDRLTATPFIEFVHPHDRNMVLSHYGERLKGENAPERYAYRINDAQGIKKWVEVSSVAVEWKGRSATLAIINNVTERKIMEQELFKADKLESLGILAGGIAHDFNNYLATLLGNTSLAKLYTDNPPKILEKLENIERATLRAKDLSNQLFAFSKGAAPLKKTVPMNNLLQETVNFSLSGTNISCGFVMDKNLHMVEIDENQVGQVFNNIIINSVQAMPGGGKILVKAENVTVKKDNNCASLPLPEGRYVKSTITDEGIGIPHKYLHKIFDPFFTTKQTGSGLGLATAYTIIQKHGGHLNVASEIGVGTSFFIFLPAADHLGTGSAIDSNIYYGTGKILVMDDQKDFLEATGEALTTLGYDVVPAKDGAEAIKAYIDARREEQPFDLLIMDLTIPGGLGGKDTIKILLEKDPEVKAIVSSGYSDDPVMANYSKYGFKGVLRKPFTLEELSMVVYKIMN